MQDQPELSPLSPAPPPPPPDANPRNIPGLISFVIGLLGVLMYCLAFLISIMVGSGTIPYTGSIIQIIGLMQFCTAGLALIGVILGIVGLLQREKKKVFAIIGLILNLLAGCVFVFFFVYGMMISGF